MKLDLKPESVKLIETWVHSGKFASPEAVVDAALQLLEDEQHYGDFAPGELEQLIKEGEESGDRIDADQAFAELMQLRSKYKSKAG